MFYNMKQASSISIHVCWKLATSNSLATNGIMLTKFNVMQKSGHLIMRDAPQRINSNRFKAETGHGIDKNQLHIQPSADILMEIETDRSTVERQCNEATPYNTFNVVRVSKKLKLRRQHIESRLTAEPIRYVDRLH
jgi:hypothetical protein